jgi:hypothetical protein
MSRVAESQPLREEAIGESQSSDSGDDSYDEPWDVPRPHSQDSAEDKKDDDDAGQKTRPKMRGTATNEIGELPALSISRSDEEEMSDIHNRERKSRGGGVLTGQRTMRPLSPPSLAGMPRKPSQRQPQDRDDVEDDDMDEETYVEESFEEDDDMPMDERMDYQKRLSEALCVEGAIDASGENLCAYTLTKMGEMCGGSPTDGSPKKYKRSNDSNADTKEWEDDNEEERRELRLRQDIPSGVEEQTAIEVEYVEPTHRFQAKTPPRRRKESRNPLITPPKTTTDPPEDIPSPPRRGVLHAFSRNKSKDPYTDAELTSRDPYKERADTAKPPGQSRETERTLDVPPKSPKRKTALLNAMTKRAKEDYEKGKVQTSEPSSEESPAPDNAYSSFSQSEKRKFLKLINSGLTPSDATHQVVEERISGEAAMEQVGEGSSSKNSRGRLTFWKRGKDENVPKEITPEETPTAPVTPRSVDGDDDDDSRFARSGIGYYDAVRKEAEESVDDERRKSLAMKKWQLRRGVVPRRRRRASCPSLCERDFHLWIKMKKPPKRNLGGRYWQESRPRSCHRRDSTTLKTRQRISHRRLLWKHQTARCPSRRQQCPIDHHWIDHFRPFNRTSKEMMIWNRLPLHPDPSSPLLRLQCLESFRNPQKRRPVRLNHLGLMLSLDQFQ